MSINDLSAGSGMAFNDWLYAYLTGYIVGPGTAVDDLDPATPPATPDDLLVAGRDGDVVTFTVGDIVDAANGVLAQSEGVVVSNTTTAVTTLENPLTIPAHSLRKGDSVVLEWYGSFRNNSGNARSGKVTYAVNGVPLFAPTLSSLASSPSNDRSIIVRSTIYFSEVGESGEVSFFNQMLSNNGAGSSALEPASSAFNQMRYVPVDTTQPFTFDILADLEVASSDLLVEGVMAQITLRHAPV